MFVEGRNYTRMEIHEARGGGLQDYLPHCDGRVVAVCITPEMNPNAPEVLLVGSSEDVQRYGAILAAQRQALPVFLKVGASEWQYRGDYVVTGSSTAPEEVTRWATASGRADVTRVVFMQRGRGAEAARSAEVN
jgi:hypothetical protein